MATETDAPAGRPAPAASSAERPPVPDADSKNANGEPRKRKFDSGRGRGRGRGGRGGGGRGGRDRQRGGDRKWQNSERKEGEGQGDDKRERGNDWHGRKRMKVDENGHRVATGEGDGSSYMSIQFSKDEIDAEERKPKRKVAVMIGYAGTGYHGMQINHKEKTIEGDLFGAFVAAQAISKVNADDPRKSSLVRCARTDKGVHAAGNVISLKLIIEDPDVVKKINDALPPQIRVWGIQRTNNAFSSYQTCDSRWYEYLMPSYCLLPPHPESFLGKKVQEAVKEKGLEEEYSKRVADVATFWEDVEKNDIQPIIDSLEPRVREEVLRRRHTMEAEAKDADETAEEETAAPETAPTEEAPPAVESAEGNDAVMTDASGTDVAATDAPTTEETKQPEATTKKKTPKQPNAVDVALKKIKAAYVAAKRRYRVSPERLSQLQQALDQYVGTKNYHNYTIQKPPTDPSAKRNIKSFEANPEPVQINDTQWLSLKVHGQSFMMHQIRKMVGMAVLLTRCATDLDRINQSYEHNRISIPKAPGLGLLLERPVFTNYNLRARDTYDRPEIDFANYEKEIQEFKDTHIYRRIFELEEKENSFHTFFHQIDNFKSDYFLWVTANGISGAHKRVGQADDVPEAMKEGLGDEGEEDVEGGEG